MHNYCTVLTFHEVMKQHAFGVVGSVIVTTADILMNVSMKKIYIKNQPIIIEDMDKNLHWSFSDSHCKSSSSSSNVIMLCR